MAKKAPYQSPINGTQMCRSATRILRVNPKTVAKKRLFLGAIGEKRNKNDVMNYSTVDHIQFDEFQTIEHPST